MFDAYIDGCQLTGNAYGIQLKFQLSSSETGLHAPIDVGVVRMSFEHFKLLTFTMARQMRKIEDELGIVVPISTNVLSGVKIAPEDWNAFWR